VLSQAQGILSQQAQGASSPLGDMQLLSSFINAYSVRRVYDGRNGMAFNLDNSGDALDFIVQFANNTNLVSGMNGI
jgi:hypothetical protein